MSKINKTVVLNVVGLSERFIGENTPHLMRLKQEGESASLATVTPAVTCSVQSSFVTGTLPAEHGCVANGWYFRDLSEIWFWRQSNHLVAGEKIWEAARKIDRQFTCAKLFWWYNMYSSADFSVTPRPMYPADGRKIPDIYTFPGNLRDELSSELGPFPLFHFWGPKADIKSSRWIADSAKIIERRFSPSLSLVYLPHLDYNLQRLGPDHSQISQDLRQIDQVCGDLIHFFKEKQAKIIVLSEYAMNPVSGAIHINRLLREAGFISVRREMNTEKLDAGASRAFAVSDHQIAHVYVKEDKDIENVRQILEQCHGIEQVLGQKEKEAFGMDHPRSGELIALAAPDRWFSYYYWLDDNLAPDFARTVDIHRKPGYDPVELFLDPNIRFPLAKIATTLVKKTLGFRTLFDVISLDTSMVKGSHGRVTSESPIFITSEKEMIQSSTVKAIEVKRYILQHLFGRDIVFS